MFSPLFSFIYRFLISRISYSSSSDFLRNISRLEPSVMQVWVRVQNRRSLGLGPFRYPQEQITELSLRVVEHRPGVLKNINLLKTLVQVSLQFIQSPRSVVELPPPQPGGPDHALLHGGSDHCSRSASGAPSLTKDELSCVHRLCLC